MAQSDVIVLDLRGKRRISVEEAVEMMEMMNLEHPSLTAFFETHPNVVIESHTTVTFPDLNRKGKK